MLLCDVFGRDARAGVAFAHERMQWQSQAVEQFASEDAMLDVWLVAIAADAWGIGAEDCDVVQHGGFLNELKVDA